MLAISIVVVASSMLIYPARASDPYDVAHGDHVNELATLRSYDVNINMSQPLASRLPAVHGHVADMCDNKLGESTKLSDEFLRALRRLQQDIDVHAELGLRDRAGLQTQFPSVVQPQVADEAIHAPDQARHETSPTSGDMTMADASILGQHSVAVVTAPLTLLLLCLASASLVVLCFWKSKSRPAVMRGDERPISEPRTEAPPQQQQTNEPAATEAGSPSRRSRRRRSQRSRTRRRKLNNASAREDTVTGVAPLTHDKHPQDGGNRNASAAVARRRVAAGAARASGRGSSGVTTALSMAPIRDVAGPVSVTQLGIAALLFLNYARLIELPLAALTTTVLLFTIAGVLLPFKEKPALSCGVIAAVVIVIAAACSVPPAARCPVSLSRIEIVSVDNGVAKVNERGLEDLIRSVSDSPGALYPISRSGGVNTGKSVCTNVDSRILLGAAADPRCTGNSGARNFRAMKEAAERGAGGNNSTAADDGEEGYDATVCGHTQGVFASVIKVRDIVVPAGFPRLRAAVDRLDPQGALLLLDGAGSGDPCRSDAATTKLQQVLVMTLSTHSMYHVSDQLRTHDIDALVTAAQLKRPALMASGGCHGTSSTANLAVSSRAELTIVLAKHTGLSLMDPRRTGVHLSPGGVGVEALDDAIDLDLTHRMKFFLNGHSDEMRETIAVLERNASLRLVATAPASVTKTSKALSWLPGTAPSISELEFLNALDTTSGLPHLFEPGFTRATALFNLPDALERVTPARTGTDAVATVAEFAQQVRDITANMQHIPEECLTAVQSSQCDAHLCSAARSSQASALENLRNAFNATMPFEDTGNPCEGDDPCPRELFNARFDEYLERASSETCRMLGMMLQPASCQDDLKKARNLVYDELVKLNEGRCTYLWHTSSTDGVPCDGWCPGYAPRLVQCRNSKGQPREDRCCARTMQKPESRVSCGRYSYEWVADEWEAACSAARCGEQTRNVWCRRCDGTPVDPRFCEQDKDRAGSKPPTSRPCNIEYSWTHDMSAWEGDDDKGGCGTQHPENVRCVDSCSKAEVGHDACAAAVNERPQARHRACRKHSCHCVSHYKWYQGGGCKRMECRWS